MAKNSMNDWSTTPSSNSDIGGTNIAVGCPPQDVGVYMRTLMSQVAYAVQGTGGAIPATWNVGTLYAVNVNISGALTFAGPPPGVQYGDVKYSAIGVEGNGWRLCYGQTRPRTDPLWIYLTANSLTSAWTSAYGGGDGSTTYTMPDTRDLVLAGLGNMGGTDRGLITAVVSGLNGAVLGARGGSQLAQNPGVTGSATAVSTVHDSGHVHTFPAWNAFNSGGGSSANSGTGPTTITTDSATTGISVTTAVAVSVSSTLTGTSQNLQPTMMMPILMYTGA